MYVAFENINDLTIEQSGSVFSFDLQDISLKLAMNNTDDNPLYLVFKFVHDTSINTSEMEPVIEGNRLTLVLKNYDNPLGTGTKSPIPLGTVGFKDIFLNFRVIAMNSDTEKLLFYTFYSKQFDPQPLLDKMATKKKPGVKRKK